MLIQGLFYALAGLVAASAAGSCTARHSCLSDAEASNIATRYLALYNTGAVTQLSDVTSVVSENFTSWDETGTGPFVTGPSTNGSTAFYESLTAGGNSSFTDSLQVPIFFLHTCDTVVYRWQFTAVSTGYNA
jgi:hypothetical protein